MKRLLRVLIWGPGDMVVHAEGWRFWVGMLLMSLQLCACVVVVMLPFVILQVRWMEQHHCRKVREISGDVGVGYVSGPNGGGVVTTYSGDKSCYVCDDGLEHCW